MLPIVLLIVVLLASSWHGVTAADGAAQVCLEAADKLVAAGQFKAAAAQFTTCSTQAGTQNVTAALAQFKAFNVLSEKLGDAPAGLAACKAGWDFVHAAELAWCAANASAHLNHTADAITWAHRAVAAGCYNGTCTSVQPLEGAGSGGNQQPLWDAPFQVLHRALKASGNMLGAAQAYIKMQEAKTAREWHAVKKGEYAATLAHENIPSTAILRNAAECGNSKLPPVGGANTYTPRLHIITTATDLNKEQLLKLLATAEAFDLHITILSPTAPMGHAVGGKFGLRLQLATNFMNMLHEQDYVMSVDAYDVAFAGGAEDMIKGFRKAVEGQDVALFGAETGLWPDKSLAGLYPAGRSKYRFLNAGVFMGTVRALRCLMSAAMVNLKDNNYVFNDDQLVFSTLFLHTVNSSRPLIKLDYGHNVFAPLWDKDQFPTMNYWPNDWEPVTGRGLFKNKLTGGIPQVFHANGNQPLSYLWNTLVPMVLKKAKEDRNPQPQLAVQPVLPQAAASTTPQHLSLPKKLALPHAASLPELEAASLSAGSSLMDWIRDHTTPLIIVLFAMLIMCEVVKAWSTRQVTIPSKTL